MFTHNFQEKKSARIILFTLSLLLTTSLQASAKPAINSGEFWDVADIKKPALGLTGKHVTVAVIDGPFDPRSDTRRVLSKQTLLAYADKDPELIADLAADDDYGRNHANHVSSIIHKVAKDAELRVIDLSNEPGVKDAVGHNARLIAAIDAAIEAKATFINISQRISPDDDWNGAITQELKAAFLRAAKAGIGIIKSAGNDDEYIGSTPYTRSLIKLVNKMDGSMILATAISYESDDEDIASFSNKAGLAYHYTVAAPGDEIEAYGARNVLMPMSGTSMAAPAITGRAALIKEAYPDLSAKDILESIRRTARKERLKDHASLSRTDKYGCGVIDFRSALIKAEQMFKSR